MAAWVPAVSCRSNSGPSALPLSPPQPFVRGATDAPPENVHRLKVLLHPATGILRAREFDGRLQWDKESPLVALADVTRWVGAVACRFRPGVLSCRATPQESVPTRP